VDAPEVIMNPDEKAHYHHEDPLEEVQDNQME